MGEVSLNGHWVVPELLVYKSWHYLIAAVLPCVEMTDLCPKWADQIEEHE